MQSIFIVYPRMSGVYSTVLHSFASIKLYIRFIIFSAFSTPVISTPLVSSVAIIALYVSGLAIEV